ncbi:MAG: MFS transporter [Steroidobacteraceae bacterium]
MTSPAVPTSPEARPREGAWVALLLLSLVSFVNYVDRMVLPALAEPIKAEFGLSDTQVGLMTGFAFVLLYAFTSVPMARFADRTHRSFVLSASLAFWSVATAACGLVRTFWELLIARVCVGVGESGCQPIGYALISDYFPAHQRATAMGWFLVGNSLGVTAGFAIGGALGAAYGWRTAFLVVGLPGLLLAIAMAVLMRNPPRETSAHHAPNDESTWAVFRMLIKDRTYRTLLLVNGVYSVLIFGPVAWLPTFFMRSHGLDLGSAGGGTGLAIGFGMAVGMVLGGICADRLVRQAPERPQLFCLATVIITGIAYAVVLQLPDPTWAFVATFVAAAIGALATPTNTTTIQNLCDANVRATAASLVTLMISLVGIGLAPFLIGLMSDWLAPSMGQESLRYALLISLLVSIPTAMLYWRVSKLIRNDALNRGNVALQTAAR